MPCLQCRSSMAGALRARGPTGALEDPPFLLARAGWAMGPRLAPEGFEDGRICRLCGVLFFRPRDPEPAGSAP